LDTLTERGLGVFEGTSFLDAKKLLDWESLPEPRHLHAWDQVSVFDKITYNITRCRVFFFSWGRTKAPK